MLAYAAKREESRQGGEVILADKKTIPVDTCVPTMPTNTSD